LFHHDPDRSDQQISALLQHARRLVTSQRAKLKVDAAREGITLWLGRKN